MAKMENHLGQLEREMNVTWLIIAKAGITIACSLTHSYGEISTSDEGQNQHASHPLKSYKMQQD